MVSEYFTTRFILLNDIKKSVYTRKRELEEFKVFSLGFLSLTFTIHSAAREGGGYIFNSSLPPPPASQAVRHSQLIAAESSLLRIASSRTWTGNLWFLNASR